MYVPLMNTCIYLTLWFVLQTENYSNDRPVTYFLYEGLSEEKLLKFLINKQASRFCIEDAVWKLKSLKSGHTKHYVERYSNNYDGRNQSFGQSCQVPNTNTSTSTKVTTLDTTINKSNNAVLFDYAILTPRKKNL